VSGEKQAGVEIRKCCGREPAYPDKEAEYWGKAVNTLSSMCVAYLAGRGPTKAAFVWTLRMYADGLEALGLN